MLPLGPLILTGVGALISGAYGVSSSLHDKNLNPELGGVGTNKLMVGLGLLGTLIGGATLAPLAAGVAIGGAIAEYQRQQVSTGLAVQQLNQAQAQVPPYATPLLPDNSGAPAPTPARPAQQGGFLSNFLNLWSSDE